LIDFESNEIIDTSGIFCISRSSILGASIKSGTETNTPTPRINEEKDKDYQIEFGK